MFTAQQRQSLAQQLAELLGSESEVCRVVNSDIRVRRTHSIGALVTMPAQAGVRLPVADDEAELLDSIHLPSRYPLGSVLPDFEPDRDRCARCIDIAARLRDAVAEFMMGET